MRIEMMSIHIQNMMESLISAHALANMYRVSNNKETLQYVEDWVPRIESSLNSLKREIEYLKGEREL